MASTDQLGYPTLMDVASEYSSMDGGARILEVAKVLHRDCPLVKALPLFPSNQMISHVGARETYLGTANTRRFNEPISPTDSKSAPFAEGIALYEDYSEIDAELLRIQPNKEKFRMARDARKLEGIRQAVEYDAFYASLGDDPSKFNGLATRFAASTSRPNGDTSWPFNVKLAGGSGADTASIWLVELGEMKVYGVYPQNVPMAGWVYEDLGKATKESSGKLMEVYRSHFIWYLGLVVEDERCVQRIANIETAGSSNIFDPEALVEMKNNLPGRGSAPGTVIFCNRTIATQMDIQALNKSNGYYTPGTDGDIWGRSVTRFQGIPVLTADKLLTSETAIS